MVKIPESTTESYLMHYIARIMSIFGKEETDINWMPVKYKSVELYIS